MQKRDLALLVAAAGVFSTFECRKRAMWAVPDVPRLSEAEQGAPSLDLVR